MNKRINNFICFIVLFIIEIVIALFVHDSFIRPYIGDILVIMLLYFFVKIFLTKQLKWLSVFILIFAVFIEIGQYFNIVALLGLENIKIVKIIIGSTFDIKDIICYFIGYLIIFVFETLSNKRINFL